MNYLNHLVHYLLLLYRYRMLVMVFEVQTYLHHQLLHDYLLPEWNQCHPQRVLELDVDG